MRAILFDCDGTIADSFGTICETMRAAFAAHALPGPEDAATRAIIGLSLEEAIGRLHPEGEAALIKSLAEGYRSAFRQARISESFREHLFPGMRELIVDLAERPDVLLGLVTGKSRRGVEAICASAGLDDLFAAIRTADDCPSKPHPAMVVECCAEFGIAPMDAVVVGDAIFDMEMAVAAGTMPIGVSWGACDEAALAAAGAQAVATSVADLRAILDRWLSTGLGPGEEISGSQSAMSEV